ncbi:MAG: divalent-cation tolerance protein CutA [Deltaproteobacteria bacterium]|nr:divalent-cation tolerance protein CutA [Deltaproteobacteria bacterium]
MDFILVLTTCSSNNEAQNIANLLVAERLAACASISSPIMSVYHWQGKIEHAEEYQLIIKTRSELFDKIKTRIKDIHSYQTAEIIAIPILNGSDEYFQWLEQET